MSIYVSDFSLTSGGSGRATRHGLLLRLRRSEAYASVTFETAPVRHVLGVGAGRRHDADCQGTRPVPGQSPVLTRAAFGRVPTGSYSSAGQLSDTWRGPGGSCRVPCGIPTGSCRVFEPRPVYGQYESLMIELCREHHCDFKSFLRMEPQMFETYYNV
ncbi:hypothetical protein Bbelb_241470 [Branchiostoma belcheri]|nr:hypothetical protein Bbelb_241470 [Branchiostoma belcheri]